MTQSKMITGIPEEELNAHKARVQTEQLRAYKLALDIARMDEEHRRFTGYRNADQVLLESAKQQEKWLVALEKKYPS